MNGEWCDEVVIVEFNCVPGSPHFDPENMVCANDNQWDEAYCSYSIGYNEAGTRGACAYCAGIVYVIS